MAWLRCEAIRWVSDEPFPGWIEVALTDADGQVWRLFDKAPIFEHNVPITRDTRFPVGVVVQVAVVEDGEPVVVSTAPDGVMSEEGQQEFRVPASAIEH